MGGILGGETFTTVPLRIGERGLDRVQAEEHDAVGGLRGGARASASHARQAFRAWWVLVFAAAWNERLFSKAEEWGRNRRKVGEICR